MSGKDPDKAVGSFLTKLVIFGLVVAGLMFLWAYGQNVRESREQQEQPEPTISQMTKDPEDIT